MNPLCGDQLRCESLHQKGVTACLNSRWCDCSPGTSSACRWRACRWTIHTSRHCWQWSTSSCGTPTTPCTSRRRLRCTPSHAHTRFRRRRSLALGSIQEPQQQRRSPASSLSSGASQNCTNHIFEGHVVYVKSEAHPWSALPHGSLQVTHVDQVVRFRQVPGAVGAVRGWAAGPRPLRSTGRAARRTACAGGRRCAARPGRRCLCEGGRRCGARAWVWSCH